MCVSFYIISIYKVFYINHLVLVLHSKNVVAEHKNRHLVEVARTLPVHSNVPLCFCVDIFLTACYLIIYVPSPVLQNQASHSILLPKQDLYFLLVYSDALVLSLILLQLKICCMQNL